MIEARNRLAPVVTFALLLTGIYVAVGIVLARMGQLDSPEWVALGITADLTLLVPILYYFLMVRWKGWPGATVLPVFVLSVLLAQRWIPEGHQHALDWIGYLAVVGELAVAAFLVRQVSRVRAGYRERATLGGDFYDLLRGSARSALGPIVGSALAYEVALLYYALIGWRIKAGSAKNLFSIHRASGYTGLVAAVFMMGFIELFAVHLLVQMWSVTAAWILSVLSVYGVVWLLGDTQAIRTRLTEIDATAIHLRVGLRWTGTIPRNQIEGVAIVSERRLAKSPGYLCAALIGQPNRRLKFDRDIELLGPYGLRRQVSVLDLQLDDAERFDAALGRPA